MRALLLLLLASPAFAERRCASAGKPIEFDIFHPEPGSEGEVRCEGDINIGDAKSGVFIVKKGRIVEERLSSPTFKRTSRYAYQGERRLRDGEQVEYFPGTDKVQQRSRFKLDDQDGLEESFYPSGKRKERALWTAKHPDTGGPMRLSSVSYGENGAVEHVLCAPKREQNVDPKLCGFDGPSAVVVDNGLRSERRVYKNGEVASEEASVDAEELAYGSLPRPDAKIRQGSERLAGGVRITQKYADGRLRRAARLGADRLLEGEDEEFFEDGKKARRIVWDRLGGRLSASAVVCWWRNGRKKLELERSGSEFTARSYYDRGALRSEGLFAAEPDRSHAGAVAACDPDVNGLVPIGLHRSYHENGKLAAEWGYKDGRRDGDFRNFREDGSLAQEGRYEADRLVRLKKYEGGKLALDEEYLPDGSRK